MPTALNATIDLRQGQNNKITEIKAIYIQGNVVYKSQTKQPPENTRVDIYQCLMFESKKRSAKFPVTEDPRKFVSDSEKVIFNKYLEDEDKIEDEDKKGKPTLDSNGNFSIKVKMLPPLFVNENNNNDVDQIDKPKPFPYYLVRVVNKKGYFYDAEQYIQSTEKEQSVSSKLPVIEMLEMPEGYKGLRAEDIIKWVKDFDGFHYGHLISWPWPTLKGLEKLDFYRTSDEHRKDCQDFIDDPEQKTPYQNNQNEIESLKVEIEQLQQDIIENKNKISEVKEDNQKEEKEKKKEEEQLKTEIKKKKKEKRDDEGKIKKKEGLFPNYDECVETLNTPPGEARRIDCCSFVASLLAKAFTETDNNLKLGKHFWQEMNLSDKELNWKYKGYSNIEFAHEKKIINKNYEPKDDFPEPWTMVQVFSKPNGYYVPDSECENHNSKCEIEDNSCENHFLSCHLNKRKNKEYPFCPKYLPMDLAGQGHTFLIIDSNYQTKKILTLEANHNFCKINGVGFRGIGSLKGSNIDINKNDRNKGDKFWWETPAYNWKQPDKNNGIWEWETFKKKYKYIRMGRINIYDLKLIQGIHLDGKISSLNKAIFGK